MMNSGRVTSGAYDLIVIGGGITGAGVARDASLRGLSVLLLEKRDFASGVSSRTTRLIHGGLRYLANFEFDLVAESLRERAIIRRLAPYLVRPIPILIPIYKGDPHGRAVISMGIHLYDLLSHEKDIPHYFTAGRDRTLGFEPRLMREGLKGSALFYDHQIMMPERLVMENIISAREAGAMVKSYTMAEKIEQDREGVVVTVRDMLSSAVSRFRAKTLIIAAGPWADEVRRSCGIERSLINPTKGIHLVLPRLSDHALFVTSRDDRMFFIIPLAEYSLIGTTDTKYNGDLDEVHADPEDIDYLLRESRRILPELDLRRESILYTYAGIRPLAFEGEKESRISRKHVVLVDGRIITIAGGKLTTYRSMARDAVDAACRLLGVRRKCITDRSPLPGSLDAPYDEYLKESIPGLSEKYGIGPETVRHLIGLYGAKARHVLEISREDPRLRERIAPAGEDIYAQVVHSVLYEEAKTLSDIILRRLYLGITSDRGLPYADRIADIAGQHLDWSADEKEEMKTRFAYDVMKGRAFERSVVSSRVIDGKKDNPAQ